MKTADRIDEIIFDLFEAEVEPHTEPITVLEYHKIQELDFDDIENARNKLKIALTEHDNEIKAMIDEMIRKANPSSEDYKSNIDYDEHLGYRQALTELKQWIEEKK